eukprot:gene14899-biopygen23145
MNRRTGLTCCVAYGRRRFAAGAAAATPSISGQGFSGGLLVGKHDTKCHSRCWHINVPTTLRCCFV